ncbi:hypothetical protein V144x_32600 [Gimesia aquarii]|uniref:DUF1559 domain-containing protein n=2 Tax=Gimesia aquarii TaxID=2527964 RepID=A0A517VXR3_9PLAN|nr:hypothetical protein V144x_32600 [Gimesia aquarii]
MTPYCEPKSFPELYSIVMKTNSKKNRYWEIFTVLTIIGILCLLLIPEVQQATSGGTRDRFRDQIRKIGAAFAYYHAEHGCFPPAVFTDPDGASQHSWRALILPQLERSFTHKERRFDYLIDEPWNSAQNESVATQNPDLYHREIRSGQADSPSTTKLVAIIDDSTLWGKGHRNQLPRLVNDEEKQILLIEIPNPDGLWNEPTDISLNELFQLIENGVFAHQGTHALFNNGEVTWLSPDDITVQKMRILLTVK